MASSNLSGIGASRLSQNATVPVYSGFRYRSLSQDFYKEAESEGKVISDVTSIQLQCLAYGQYSATPPK